MTWRRSLLAAVPVAPGGHSPAFFDPSQQPRRASLRRRSGVTWRPGCGRDPLRACGLLNWFRELRRPLCGGLRTLCGGPAAVPLPAVPVAPGGHDPAFFDPSQQPRRASLRRRPGATWRPGFGRDPLRACGLLNWFQASRRPLCGCLRAPGGDPFTDPPRAARNPRRRVLAVMIRGGLSGLIFPFATAPAGFSSPPSRPTWRPGCLASGVPFGLCAGGLWRAFSGLVRPFATARRASLRRRPGVTWRPGFGRDPFRAFGLLNWFRELRRPLCGGLRTLCCGPAAVPLAARWLLAVMIRGGLSGLIFPFATAPAGLSSRPFRSTWRPGCLTSGGPFGLCAGGLWRAFFGLVRPFTTAPASLSSPRFRSTWRPAGVILSGAWSPVLDPAAPAVLLRRPRFGRSLWPLCRWLLAAILRRFSPPGPPQRVSLRRRSGQPDNLAAGVILSGPWLPVLVPKAPAVLLRRPRFGWSLWPLCRWLLAAILRRF